jgi:hypothetical protein
MLAMLILKRASASRSSGQWQDEDYDVLADGKVVGRIHEHADLGTPPELRWFWSITEIVPAVPNTPTAKPFFMLPYRFANPRGPQQNADGVFNASEDDAAFAAHHPRRELEKAKANLGWPGRRRILPCGRQSVNLRSSGCDQTGQGTILPYRQLR